jgi:hypothetical protein
MDLKEIDVLGPEIHTHWYYESKAKATKAFLSDISPNGILDIGAGSGFFSRYLLEHTEAIKASCVDINYEQNWEEHVAGKPIRFFKEISAVDANVVLLMDVLEHVEDDTALLTQYVELAPVGASFLISVPAFQFLWSGHDIFLGHHRRYTLGSLKKLVKQSGLEVKKSAFYFGFVFPIAAVLRLIDRLKRSPHLAKSSLVKHGKVVNGLLTFLCNIELFIMRFNKLAGLSIFCVAVKKDLTN